MQVHHSQHGVTQFASLYDANFHAVFRLLLRLGVGPAAAEDAAQETFVVAYRKMRGVADHPRAWLFAIARRVAADYRRGTRRRAARHKDLPDPTTKKGPEDLIRATEAEALVAAFLHGLSPIDRDIFVLSELEGLSLNEAAAATGVKRSTLHSRLVRIRESLQSFVAMPARREE